jgi:hypothetical protein
MNYLSNPTASTICRTSEWLEFGTDTYLDHRHRNWVLAEELGDVIFIAARGVVLVHRERAEHIARALRAHSEVILTLPTRTFPELRLLPPPSAVREVEPPLIRIPTGRWRGILGWLGIVAGAVVFVAALALSLDDPALIVALAIGMRGGRLILDIDS